MLPRGIDKTRPLTREEHTEFRSCAGSLQYLAGNSRPDLSAGVSLSQRKDMTVEQLDQIYKLNNYAIASADLGLKIQKVNLFSACVVGFGDSA